MEGYASYWVVIAFVVILCFAVFILRPKSRRSHRRREPIRARDLMRVLVAPIATVILVGLAVAAYVYVKTSS